jgi:hypothetical protein
MAEIVHTRTGTQMGIDYKEWPLERRYEKAAMWGFLPWSDLFWKLHTNLGAAAVEKSAREMGVHLANKAVLPTLKEFGVKGNHCITAASFFWLADQLAFGGIGFIIKELTPRRVLAQQAPFGVCFCYQKEFNCSPLEVPELPKLCMAYTDYERTACRLINPKIKYTIHKLVSRGDDCCEVSFELPPDAEIDDHEWNPGKRTGIQQGIYWEEWPIERRYKAACRWSSLWYACVTWRLLENLGIDAIRQSVIEGQKEVARHRYETMFRELGIPTRDVGAALSYFMLSEQIGANTLIELESLTPRRAVYRKLQPKHGGCALHDPAYTIHPAKLPHGRQFCEAYTAYEAEMCRLINPHIRFTLGKSISRGDPYCEYILELVD